jgi:predicted alpha/beta-hydrolase family hydrolase
MSHSQIFRWSLLFCLGTACSGESDATDTQTVGDTSDDGGAGSGGDQDTGNHSEDEGDTGGQQDSGSSEAQDYRQSGSYGVNTTSESVSVSSCTMSATVYSPAGGSPIATVVLSHGFARSQSNMVGWAEHYASWGFKVVTPALCHSSLWDTDHSQNADDLIDLAGALAEGGVIYAGQSAGGLSSLLAGSRDEEALGVMGLDATDAGDIGLSAASSIGVPVYGLAGEPSSCNASNNGLDVYASLDQAQVLRVTEADHCDFESDTDAVCTVFCEGSNDQFSDDEIRMAILGLSTSALLSFAGQSEAAAGWWMSSGVFFRELDELGIISAP